jgi:hypothetical protein
MPDAPSGKIHTPLGDISKKTALIGGVGVAAVGGIIYYRYRKNAASQASSQQSSANSSGSGTVTDPAGNVCAQVDPTTGYCPGTPEDEAAQESAAEQVGVEDTGDYGYGEGSGEYYTDPNGNICVAPLANGYCPGSVSNTSPSTTPETNAQWAENVEETHPNWESAIDKVLGGVAVTTAQANDWNEAVGLYGQPPQPYPPIKTKDTGGQPKTPKVNPGGKMVTANGHQDAYAVAKSAGISETKFIALNPQLAKYVGSKKDIPAGQYKA